MTTEISNKLAHQKLNLFIKYLVTLSDNELHEVLKDLPENFQEKEKDDISYHVNKIIKLICGKCRTFCCC
jgi:hypothetical protein